VWASESISMLWRRDNSLLLQGIEPPFSRRPQRSLAASHIFNFYDFKLKLYKRKIGYWRGKPIFGCAHTHTGKRENSLALPEIELRFLCLSARSLVNVLLNTKVFRKKTEEEQAGPRQEI
jgi:hypothetical protein